MEVGLHGNGEHMILHSRYINDGISVLPLNELQRRYIRQVNDKIQAGHYSSETVPCAICCGNSFEIIAHKDRYGFELSLAICKDCGLAQTNPRMTQEAYNNFYNLEYRFIYGGDEGPTPKFFEDQYNRLGKRIYNLINSIHAEQSLKNKFVLEVGCGAGGILKFFKDQGCRIKGIDLGGQYVEYGKTFHNLDLEVMPIEKLQLDQKPDVIIYSHVLEHILDLKGQLSYIRSLMHENTLLYIEVPGLKNLHRSYNTDLLLYLQNAHVYHFTKLTLLNLLNLNGFDNVIINDFVQSIFKKSDFAKSNESIVSEYTSIIKYLRSVEWSRKIFPVPPYMIKFYLKRWVYNLLSLIKIVPPLSKN